MVRDREVVGTIDVVKRCMVIKTKPDSLIPEATGNKHCKCNAFFLTKQDFARVIVTRYKVSFHSI